MFFWALRGPPPPAWHNKGSATTSRQRLGVPRECEPTAATTAIENLNGRIEGTTKIEAHFWDGVTDYTVKDLDQERLQEEERLEEFGDWLESQEELPDELQLQVESN